MLNNKEIEKLKENIDYINESILALNLKIEDLENDYKKFFSKIDNKEKLKSKEVYLNYEDKSRDLNNKIKELYEQGLTVDEISSTLRIGKGKYY
ncbi:DUF6115 domain-containing protein [Caloramator sp. mosi_1]|uniref:DUF6115 domain-containing protein n=1 Tax=Caloramator sp. mosi_1 TaxID=3023090 RepID=UPI003FCD4E07